MLNTNKLIEGLKDMIDSANKNIENAKKMCSPEQLSEVEKMQSKITEAFKSIGSEGLSASEKLKNLQRELDGLGYGN